MTNTLAYYDIKFNPTLKSSYDAGPGATTLSITTFSIMTLTIKGLFAIFSIMTVSTTTLSPKSLCYYAECHYAECCGLFIAMLNAKFSCA